MRFALLLVLCGCSSIAADSVEPDTERFRLAGTRMDSSWRSSFCGMCSAAPRDMGVRVYATGRTNRGSVIGWMDFDRQWNRVAESSEPCLVPGTPGSFDDVSVFMPFVIRNGDEHRMYFGAHGGGRFPSAETCVGMATSTDGGNTWIKHPSPVLNRDEIDNAGISTPFVVRLSDTEWRMFYTSIRRHESGGFRGQSRFALSSDGIHWARPENNVAVDKDGRSTCSRPCVWRDGERWLALYSYAQAATETEKGRHYCVRLAESDDGLRFHDVRELIAPTGKTRDFDGEMTAYGFPIPERGVFLYSGNGFGVGGIGMARLHLAAE